MMIKWMVEQNRTEAGNQMRSVHNYFQLTIANQPHPNHRLVKAAGRRCESSQVYGLSDRGVL